MVYTVYLRYYTVVYAYYSGNYFFYNFKIKMIIHMGLRF